MRFSLHREPRGQLPPGMKDAYVESPSAQEELEARFRVRDQERPSWQERLERAERRRQKRLERDAQRRALKLTKQVEPVSRHDIIVRDASTCYLCGRLLTADEVHLDHVIPLARGGAHTADNLRVACAPCNQSKGATMPSG